MKLSMNVCYSLHHFGSSTMKPSCTPLQRLLLISLVVSRTLDLSLVIRCLDGEASGSAPIHHLRALMLHLRSNARFAAVCPQVLEILSQVPPDQTTTIVLPSWTQGSNDDLRPQLRKSLTTHLFGWPNLLSLRMRLSIADLCWVRELRASNLVHLQYFVHRNYARTRRCKHSAAKSHNACLPPSHTACCAYWFVT